MAYQTIRIVEKILSDGSPVYDVVLNDMILPAITENDAHKLVDALRDAIHTYTNEIVRYMWE